MSSDIKSSFAALTALTRLAIIGFLFGMGVGIILIILKVLFFIFLFFGIGGRI